MNDLNSVGIVMNGINNDWIFLDVLLCCCHVYGFILCVGMLLVVFPLVL